MVEDGVTAAGGIAVEERCQDGRVLTLYGRSHPEVSCFVGERLQTFIASRAPRPCTPDSSTSFPLRGGAFLLTSLIRLVYPQAVPKVSPKSKLLLKTLEAD